jgi:hypothetical protein
MKLELSDVPLGGVIQYEAKNTSQAINKDKF